MHKDMLYKKQSRLKFFLISTKTTENATNYHKFLYNINFASCQDSSLVV